MSEHLKAPPAKGGSSEKMVLQLQEEVAGAVRHKPPLPVNFGRYRHRWLVEGLHGLVYGDDYSDRTIKKVRVAFTDGSETSPFPIFCLPPPSLYDKRKEYVLRVGLNSGRHPELDRQVELYLFRNSEVNEWESFAEQEEEAYLQSMQFLQDPEWRQGGIIEMYQTGLEPLILGFYRAVVESARAREREKLPRLNVEPRVFVPGVSLNISRLLKRQFNSQLKPDKLRAHVDRKERLLRKMSGDLEGFFDLRRQGQDLIFQWVPERPMWTTEHDYLHLRYPSIREIVSKLYNMSQYTSSVTWG